MTAWHIQRSPADRFEPQVATNSEDTKLWAKSARGSGSPRLPSTAQEMLLWHILRPLGVYWRHEIVSPPRCQRGVLGLGRLLVNQASSHPLCRIPLEESFAAVGSLLPGA